MMMATFRKVLPLLAVIYLTTSPSMGQNLITEMAGDWREYELNGIDSWNNGKCIIVTFTERAYSLNPFSDSTRELHGSFVNRFHGRFMFNAGQDCKYLDQTKPEALYANTRIWDFTGKQSDQNTVSIAAEFTKCMDWGCNPLETFKGPFSTNLRLDSASVLTDFGDESSFGVVRHFYRQAEHARLAQDVEKGLDNIIQLILSGKYDQLRNQYMSSLNTDSKAVDNSFSQIPIYRKLLKKVTSRSVMETRFAHRMGFDKQIREGSFGIIFRELFLQNGGNGIESAVLHKENGRWKVISLFFQA